MLRGRENVETMPSLKLVPTARDRNVALPADRSICASFTWHLPSLDLEIQGDHNHLLLHRGRALLTPRTTTALPYHRQSLPRARWGHSLPTTSRSTLGALLVSPPGYAPVLHKARLALWLQMNRSLGVSEPDHRHSQLCPLQEACFSIHSCAGRASQGP
jgi:hypothetical protein